MLICLMLILFQFNSEIGRLCGRLLTIDQWGLFTLGGFAIGLYAIMLCHFFRKNIKDVDFVYLLTFLSSGTLIAGAFAYQILYQLDGFLLNAQTVPIIGAVIEELLKLAIFSILLFSTQDGFSNSYKNLVILASLVGLGFQIYEDYIQVLTQIESLPVDFVRTMIYRLSRFFASHWMYTGIAGFGFVLINHKKTRKSGFLWLCIPIVLHIVWNSSWNNTIFIESILSTITIAIYTYVFKKCSSLAMPI